MRKSIIFCVILAFMCTLCACSENKASHMSGVISSSSAEVAENSISNESYAETQEKTDTVSGLHGSESVVTTESEASKTVEFSPQVKEEKSESSKKDVSVNEKTDSSVKTISVNENTDSSGSTSSTKVKKEKNEAIPESKIDIGKCRISVESFPADGSTIYPTVRIYYKKQPLREDIDYSITYIDPSAEMGEHELLVRMAGRFEGEQRAEYQITPSPAEISGFSAKVSRLSVFWNEVKEIDGYEIQHSDNKDFSEAITLIKKPDVSSLGLSGLTENTVKYFRIRTFRAVNGKNIYSQYSKVFEAPVTKVERINGATYIDGILIANKTYALPEGFGSGEDQEALNAFYKMQRDASRQGLSINIISGFRSYYTQLYTYQYFVNDRGREAADRVSARPGHSEHQTGLAFDINSTSFAFTDTPEAKWLAENCAEYGFIIRYPQGKEDVTGYSYESWHIRYLGVDKAKRISESGLTLEEYYGFTSKYSE